jgi:hypothetical protein
MKNNKELEGCVFFAFDKKETQTKKQKISKIHKIVQINFFIENEITNQKKLLKFNNRKIYFYLCENTSQLKITEIDERDIKIKNKNLTKDDTILLEFEDRQLINLKTYLKDLSSSKKYILTIIDFYKHLLNSIRLLVENNVFHNQINFESIVIDKFDYPLLDNFSFSIDYSRADIDKYIKHFIIAYDPTYIEWPLELHILSYLLTNNLDSLSSYNIEYIIHEVTTHNNILNTFGDSVVSSFKKEALQYFKKYVNQSYKYILTDILQYSHSWDNYALSILFLRVLIGIHRSIEIKNKFIMLFMKLLVSNIHLNPFKRNSVDMTITNFDSLLDRVDPKDYKDIINSLMST